MSQLKWGVVLSYTSMAIGTLISLAYTPFMLRLLGQSEYGLYSLVASVVSYLGLLSFGFGAAYVRYYSRASRSGGGKEIAQLNGLFLLIFSAIGLVALGIGALMIANIGSVLGDKLTGTELATARVLMALMTFTVAVSFPASVFSSFLTANERFVFQRVLQLAQTMITPAITLVVLVVGYKSIGMAAVASAAAVVAASITIWYCFTHLEFRFSFRDIDWTLAGEIAVFSSFIFVNMVVDQVNWNVDKFILGRISGTAAVAIYGLAGQLNGYYMSLSSTISAVFVPRVNKMIAYAADPRELTALFTRVGRVQFLVLALVASGLVVLGRPFIHLWAGASYEGAYPILILMVLPVSIPLIQNLGIEIQRAMNLHKFRSWLYLGIAVMNVALSIPLALRYGGVGAAAGTAASLIIGNGILMNVYYQRRVGLDMRYFWSEILRLVPALAPVAAVGAVIGLLVEPNDVQALVWCGAAFIAVYVLSMWLFGMNDYEKHLVADPVQKFLARR